MMPSDKKFDLCAFGLGAFLVAFLSGCASQNHNLKINPFDQVSQADADAAWGDARSQIFQIVYSGNLNGEIHPCGCALGPKGGLDRRLNFLQMEPVKGVRLVVDAGNALFSTENLSQSDVERLKPRAQKILAAHKVMGLGAQGVGRLDLVAGVDYLRQSAKEQGVDIVSANLTDTSDQILFQTHKNMDIQGRRVSIVGLSEPSGREGVKWQEPLPALRKVINTIPRDHLVVVLSTLGTSVDERLAQDINRPMIFVGAQEATGLDIPMQVGSSVILRSQYLGQQWGVIDVLWRSESQQWLSPELAETFQRRYENWKVDYQQVAQLPSSEERNTELEKLSQAALAMRAYAVNPKVTEVSLYNNRFVNLDERYVKKNKLSALME